jgi:phenylacetate-CoA ligase
MPDPTSGTTSRLCREWTWKKLQVEQLRAGIDRVSKVVPFYKKKLGEAGVTADSIRSLEDLERLPFTTKADLRDNYPFGLVAVPMKEVIRLHASSGTTGNPTVVNGSL